MADEKISPIGQTFSDFNSPPIDTPVNQDIVGAPAIPTQSFSMDRHQQITGSSEDAPLFNPQEAIMRRLTDLVTLPEDAADKGEAIAHDKQGNPYLVDYEINHNEDGTGRVTLIDKRAVAGQNDLAKDRAHLSQKNIELKQENKELGEQAIFDKLTSVLNRRGIELEGDKFLKKLSDDQGQGLAIVLDIDHFKQTNDTYGHPTGDIVLRELAQQLTKVLRPDDLVGRWGGEEFVILLKTPQDREKITVIAERIRATIETHAFDQRNFDQRKHEIRKTVSMGLARFDPPFNAPTLAELVAQADEELYAVKTNGRNGFAYNTGRETIIHGANGRVIKFPNLP